MLSLGLTVRTNNILEVIFLLVWLCSRSGFLGNKAAYGELSLLGHSCLSSTLFTSSLAHFSWNFSPKSSISPGSPRIFRIRYLTSFIMHAPRPWSLCLPLPPCSSYKALLRQSPQTLDKHPNLPLNTCSPNPVCSFQPSPSEVLLTYPTIKFTFFCLLSLRVPFLPLFAAPLSAPATLKLSFKQL